ncbi:MAG: hypothetical protein Q4F78_01645 [Bacillota bacterium]|nr:hypothetical protein [Bacillota bacterium]
MFRNTRKKQLRNRVIAAALGVTVMTFGIWLNYKDQAEETPVENTVKEIKITETEDNKEEPSTINAPESYLIKEIDGVVKVFLCDENGNEELYLITSIPFELLSESDQKLFIDGVRLDTEEDLGRFLENFDS